jgi:hypothetical protein
MDIYNIRYIKNWKSKEKCIFLLAKKNHGTKILDSFFRFFRFFFQFWNILLIHYGTWGAQPNKNTKFSYVSYAPHIYNLKKILSNVLTILCMKQQSLYILIHQTCGAHWYLKSSRYGELWILSIWLTVQKFRFS